MREKITKSKKSLEIITKIVYLSFLETKRESRAHIQKKFGLSVNAHWRVESRTCGGLNWEDMGKFDQGELDLFEDC